jgi:hypothetical protein
MSWKEEFDMWIRVTTIELPVCPIARIRYVADLERAFKAGWDIRKRLDYGETSGFENKEPTPLEKLAKWDQNLL